MNIFIPRSFLSDTIWISVGITTVFLLSHLDIGPAVTQACLDVDTRQPPAFWHDAVGPYEVLTESVRSKVCPAVLRPRQDGSSDHFYSRHLVLWGVNVQCSEGGRVKILEFRGLDDPLEYLLPPSVPALARRALHRPVQAPRLEESVGADLVELRLALLGGRELTAAGEVTLQRLRGQCGVVSLGLRVSHETSKQGLLRRQAETKEESLSNWSWIWLIVHHSRSIRKIRMIANTVKIPIFTVHFSWSETAVIYVNVACVIHWREKCSRTRKM